MEEDFEPIVSEATGAMAGITDDVMPKPEKAKKCIIKVVGVGGGGGNAVKHMYNEGINDVEFIICNTDKQALDGNPVPNKILIGEGLGAGAKPEVAREAALQSEDKIKAALEGAHMVFVTACMGGGTGTGASPIIASVAREMNILTVGIVTFPFGFEQEQKHTIAQEGINELKENVDALLVIKNESLLTFYPEMKMSQFFAKADDVLLIAAKSIAEIVTLESIMNVDFRDVETILKNSGTAIIGCGTANGENRAKEAVQQAVTSPLLDNDSVYGAEKMLLFISYGHGDNEATGLELKTITTELQNATCNMKREFIWGHGFDDNLGDSIRVTIIATGLHNHSEEKPTIVLENKANMPKVDTSVVNDNSQTIVERLDNNANQGPMAYRPDMTDAEITSYLNEPAYKRGKNNLEISDYSASVDGIDQQPAYLRNTVD